MNTLSTTVPQTRPPTIPASQRIKKFLAPAGVALILLSAQPCWPQESVGDMGYWYDNVGIGGFSINGGMDNTVGETFQISDGNAFVSSISVPVEWNSGATAEFQIGVAAWSGTQATGSLLYLSSALFASGSGFQTVTMPTSGLVLNQNQQYILFLTPNAFVGASSPFDTDVGLVSAFDYPAGQFVALSGTGLTVGDLFTQSWNGGAANMAFEIDYTVIPEPGVAALLCSGGLALWLRCGFRPRLRSLSIKN
jgi:hypothetical protein